MDSHFPDPFGGVFIAFKLAFVGSKFRGVIDRTAVPGAGWMANMQEFMVQDVVQHEVWDDGRIEEEADENSMVGSVIAAEYSTGTSCRPG